MQPGLAVGGKAGALAELATRMDREYVWPYQLHASIGPSCAVAEWQAGVEGGMEGGGAGEGVAAASGDRTGTGAPVRATVWAGTQNPHVLRADLARLTGLPDTAIAVVRLEASGCYGRNGADDVAADALLHRKAPVATIRLSGPQTHDLQLERRGEGKAPMASAF